MFKMSSQQGPTVQHMELCSMLCGSLAGRGAWGTMDSCVRMAESLCCAPESIVPQAPLPARLPHNIEQSSMCCTVGPC